MNPGQGKHPDGIPVPFFSISYGLKQNTRAKNPLGFGRGTETVPDFFECSSNTDGVFLRPDSYSEDRREEETLLAVQPNSALLVEVCCSLFLLSLMIKSSLRVGQAEWKHRKAASNLLQCFSNIKVCQDLWSVLIINIKRRHYIQNE